MDYSVIGFLIKNIMTGLITTRSGTTYIFRDDHGHGKGIWAWNIHGDYNKAMVYKWKKIPRHTHIELFDIEDPPETVSYQPLLD